MPRVFLTECPRDAMQGIKPFIPTDIKVSYLQSLLRVGFDVLDFGSFVSHKAVPQMRDTHEIIRQLDLSDTKTKLLAIVANARGAEDALLYPQIDYLGYPFSISENFQVRNTNKTIEESTQVLDKIANRVQQLGKELVVYLSMGFGNPYGDPWSPELVGEWVARLAQMGIRRISLSDTVGVAQPQTITSLFEHLLSVHPKIFFGAHLHAKPNEATEKIQAAFGGGCRAFDSAIRGLGGCPMAKDALTGNVPTEKLLSFLTAQKVNFPANMLHFESAYNTSFQVC
ncbi:MAG: Hydroxymethylglutaryl-CoA lyase YngG [Bacteroidota bacterium]|nr:MAG: Hydroxymethylglutaryl-CoA lyase YngG [Bacteroidota bacterium]